MQIAKTSPGRYYRPELDVVRFLAFLMVFLHHTLPHGSDARVAQVSSRFAPIFEAIGPSFGFGLSLFFTLSAFLICELLLRERQSVGTVNVKQFYIRRILRIWPLYYLGLVLAVAFAFLPGAHLSDIKGIGWYAAFMGSWYIVTMHAFESPASVLWSVSVEEQFYLFAPWIIKYFTRKWLYGFCLALITVANAWLYYLGKTQASGNASWYNTFVQFECFAAGILLCLILQGRIPRIAAGQRLILCAASGVCWFYACYGLNTRMSNGINPGSWSLMAGYGLSTLGCITMLLAFLGIDSKLLPRWSIYLGRISFGLYVFHEFALSLTRKIPYGLFMSSGVIPFKLVRAILYLVIPIGLPLGLTILMAAVSYRFLETPFLKMKKRHSLIESQPIAGDR